MVISFVKIPPFIQDIYRQMGTYTNDQTTQKRYAGGRVVNITSYYFVVMSCCLTFLKRISLQLRHILHLVK